VGAGPSVHLRGRIRDRLAFGGRAVSPRLASRGEPDRSEDGGCLEDSVRRYSAHKCQVGRNRQDLETEKYVTDASKAHGTPSILLDFEEFEREFDDRLVWPEFLARDTSAASCPRTSPFSRPRSGKSTSRVRRFLRSRALDLALG
jgi:hypothetical protein